MKFNLTTSSLLLIFIMSCNSKKTEESNVQQRKTPGIDLIEALDYETTIGTNFFIDSFTYIPLEYSEKTTIRNLGKPYLIGDSILLIKGFRRIALFNKKGDYIKDIGHYGNDPGGYRNSLPKSDMSPYQTTVFAQGWKDNYIEYSLQDGKIVNSLARPKRENNVPFKSELIIGSFTKIDSSNFLGYVVNFQGNQSEKLVIFNDLGKLLKTYKNHQSFIDTDAVVFSPTEGDFFHYNKKTFFKEDFNDTVFEVDLNGIEAKYVFNLGDKSPPYEEKETLTFSDRVNYAFIENIIETDEHLFFYVNYQGEKRIGIYYKLLDKTEIANLSEMDDLNSVGLKNDIDDFLPFYPEVIQGNNIIGVTPAEVVYNWFQSNPEKVGKLPPELRSLKDIPQDGNPVVMIGKLKTR